MQSLRAMAAGIIGLFSFSAIGCGSEPHMGNQDSFTADEAGNEPAAESEGVSENDIIVMNGSDPLFFWKPSTQKALRKLAKRSIEASLDDDDEDGDALLESAKGRALLAHVVACALPAGEAITTADGVSFDGAAGLAPHWKSEPLGGPEHARWMTACLLQTLNGLASHVPIRLTGSHPELRGGPSGEASEFTIDDATMFGDVFHASDPSAFACADTSLEDVCDLSFSEYTLLRICGQSPTCGVTFLGLCSLHCSDGKEGSPTCEAPGGGVFPEAISSHLKEKASLSVGESCILTAPTDCDEP